MTNPNADDWRLRGRNEDDFLGLEMIRKEYVPPSPSQDHDHCDFCWAKFMAVDGPDIQRAGYKTVEQGDWICDSCFGDFAQRFRWVVKE